jgi:hypothetical protein
MSKISSGIIDVRSPRSVPQTIDRLEALAKARGLRLRRRDAGVRPVRQRTDLRPVVTGLRARRFDPRCRDRPARGAIAPHPGLEMPACRIVVQPLH